MKYIKYGFWLIVAICLVIIGLANAEPVHLQAMPAWLSNLVGVAPKITVPLYVAIFAGVALGLLIGFLWEWVREHKHRVAMNARAREVNKLEREVSRLRTEKHEGKDEVLALLE